MREFRDAEGRVWRVQLDIAAAVRVDDASITHRGEILVLTDPDKWVFPALLRSPALNARILYRICRPQADEFKVDEAAFLALLTTAPGANGQSVMEGAVACLVAELIDFFQCCPTSLNRLLKMRSRVLSLLDLATQALKADTTPSAAEGDKATTACSDSQVEPASTGGRPD